MLLAPTQSSTVHFRTAPVWLITCTEWRLEGGVDRQLSPVKDREPLRNHLDPALVQSANGRVEVTQEHIGSHSGASLSTKPGFPGTPASNNWHGDGQGSREGGHTSRSARRVGEEGGGDGRARARQSWLHRWGSILSCAAPTAFACSLLGVHGNLGTDGDAPGASDVLCVFCRAPIAE